MQPARPAILLPPPQRILAASLFSRYWFDQATIHSVLESRQAGQIFVDDADHPRSALLAHASGECYLGGIPTAAVRACAVYLAETMPPPGRKYLRFIPGDAVWEQAIAADFADQAQISPRRSFAFLPSNPIAAPAPPPGFRIQPIDAESARQGNAAGEIPRLWTSIDHFLHHGFGVCAMFEAQCACWMWSWTIGLGRVEISVATRPEFRRRGLAASVGRAFLAESARRNLIPTWTCTQSNTPSADLAGKLGFTENQPYREYILAGPR